MPPTTEHRNIPDKQWEERDLRGFACSALVYPSGQASGRSVKSEMTVAVAAALVFPHQHDHPSEIFCKKIRRSIAFVSSSLCINSASYSIHCFSLISVTMWYDISLTGSNPQCITTVTMYLYMPHSRTRLIEIRTALSCTNTEVPLSGWRKRSTRSRRDAENRYASPRIDNSEMKASAQKWTRSLKMTIAPAESRQTSTRR